MITPWLMPRLFIFGEPKQVFTGQTPDQPLPSHH